jgi:hypothetical protein
MMVLPPVAAAQAGQASGGGLLDSFKSAVSGATGGTTQAAPAQTSSGDGSVGLFDGVLKKALFGGVAGAAMGFLPFLPGGPVLGGIVGALGGAAMGVFSNWRKMSQIKQENQAMIAALGVQADDPQVQQILQSGNVEQLIPLMQQQAAGVQQGGVGQTTTQSPTPAQGSQASSGSGSSSGSDVQQVTDRATGVTQTIDLVTGQVIDQSGGSATQTATQNSSALPPTVQVGSGGGAIDPSSAVSPGVAPTAGGGGSAGDAGRPPAPVGVNSANAAAVAPTQAGIATTDRAALARVIQQLQAQIDQLKAFIAAQDEAAQLDVAAAR